MKEIRKLTRTGNGRSMFVVIPAELVDALGWRDRQKVSVSKINGAVVIRDAKTKKKVTNPR